MGLIDRPLMKDLPDSGKQAFGFEAHRSALMGHCYRMLGSVSEADDAVQETMVRAWRAMDRFEGRASPRTWLYSIATRVCLDALSASGRRARPMELGPAYSIDGPLTPLPANSWIEPIPDALAVPSDVDPSEQASLRQSIRLAFLAALQHLPPKQRAVLLLAEVLGWPATEIAETLETSVASVNSALQRARVTVSDLRLEDSEFRVPQSDAQVALLNRYVDAFERYDMDAFTAILHEEVTLSMPPYTLWLQGHESIRGWFLGRGAVCRDSRLVRTEACGSPAYGQYHASSDCGPFKPWSLIVLELSGGRIAAMTHFLDTEALFPRFGLPLELPR